MSEGYSKVTIIVEDGEDTTTHIIPMAREISFGTEALVVRDGVLPKCFLTNTIKINLELIADLDATKHHIMATTIIPDPRVGEPLPKPSPSNEEELHSQCRHPDYEYRTTEGQRKQWVDADTLPDGLGWTRNTALGRNGWERFDYSEESYWKRLKKWGDFELRFSEKTRDHILRYGPNHPNHPEHEHEDCCK